MSLAAGVEGLTSLESQYVRVYREKKWQGYVPNWTKIQRSLLWKVHVSFIAGMRRVYCNSGILIQPSWITVARRLP